MHLTPFEIAILHGAVSGMVAAAGVDIHAFMQWKNWHDAATYDWGTATFRWAAGAILGAATAAGYGALFQ